MTSFPVSRDVTGRRGGVMASMVVMSVLLRLFQPSSGCILLLNGWSPMSVGERSSLADIVAVGVVRRTFKSDRSSDDVATYSAEVLLIDVFKGRRLVDSVSYRPEVRRSTPGSGSSGVNQPHIISSPGTTLSVGYVSYPGRLSLLASVGR